MTFLQMKISIKRVEWATAAQRALVKAWQVNKTFTVKLTTLKDPP